MKMYQKVVDVQANDIYLGLGDLHTNIITTPAHGTATLMDGDSISYFPELNFYGVDTFTYEVFNDDLIPLSATAMVVITVVSQPDFPLAITDYDTTSVEIAVIVDVQANDINFDPEFLQTNLIELPASGTASVIGGISVEYTPADDFTGTDSMLYAVCNASYLTFCDTAAVYIYVKPVNFFAPELTDDFATIFIDTDTTLNILANDTDGDGDDLYVSELQEAGIAGMITLNADYTVTYTGTSIGTDTMKYIGCDINSPSFCDTALIVITVIPPDTTGTSDIIIPNSFSPNGDGVNDYFVIENLKSAFNLKIYNRWGDLLFDNSDAFVAWDGSAQAEALNKTGQLPEGTYFYLLQVDGLSEPLQGYIEMRR